MTDTPGDPDENPAPPPPAMLEKPSADEQSLAPNEPEDAPPLAPIEPPAGQRLAHEPPAAAPQAGLRVPWIPIAIAAAVSVAIALGVLLWRASSGNDVQDDTYVVQPYAPNTELITARDRVEARQAPDTSSRVLVVFGQGVTLNVSGRVQRGLGNDWYALDWNGRTAFVRVQDVVAGSGAPPAPIVRERSPQEEEDDKEKPDELRDEEPEQMAQAPQSRGVLGIGDVNWIREPTGRDFARYYPDQAREKGESGNVVLSCIIGGSGRLACSIASESPPGLGFGRAAISVSRQLRVRATLPDGSSAEGREMRLPMSFRAS